MKEKRCILKELYNQDYGETVFPQYYGSRKGSWFSSKRYYYPKRCIRDGYFEEIRNILNNFQDWLWLSRKREEPREDHQKDFLEAYNRIKNGVSPDGKVSRFEWLNTREAKEAVKNWSGDPLDILYYLTRSGIIERAVRIGCKRLAAK